MTELMSWRCGFMVDPDNLPLSRPGVYRVCHRESGKSYVGASVNVAARLYQHGIGDSSCTKLQTDTGQYSHTAFTVDPLFYATSSECDLVEVEAELIVSFDSVTSGYNSRPRDASTTHRQLFTDYHTKLIRLDAELAERIVAYHHDNRIKSEAQAFRELLTRGLEAAAHDKTDSAAFIAAGRQEAAER